MYSLSRVKKTQVYSPTISWDRKHLVKKSSPDGAIGASTMLIVVGSPSTRYPARKNMNQLSQSSLYKGTNEGGLKSELWYVSIIVNPSDMYLNPTVAEAIKHIPYSCRQRRLYRSGKGC